MKPNSKLFACLAALAIGMTSASCTSDADPTMETPKKTVVNYAPAKASTLQITSGNAVLGGSNASRATAETGNTSTTTALKAGQAGVEVNLAMNAARATDDYISSKLSIHVRDTTDIEVTIPVSADLYCKADDKYIILDNNTGDYLYNITIDEVSMTIAGQKVTLRCIYSASSVTIKSEGVNGAVLNELRSTHNDGINFEVWNFYNTSAGRSSIQNLLNKSVCRCTTANYVNAVNNTATYNLDCIVSKR